MRRATRPALLLLALSLPLLAAGTIPARAQFGQNKFTYERFDWRVYPSPHFDVHYYGTIEPFLPEIVSYAESAYLKLSKDLDHELRFRVPLIVYKTHGEFQQTNVTLSELPEGVAAFAEPFQNRMILPIDLPPMQLYELIAHELTHVFQYSIFYEGYIGRALRSNAPTWLMEGMASYFAEDESNLDRMALRDAVVNNVLPPVQALNYLSFLTYRYGHAIFDFIEQEHGKEGVRTFIYEFRKVLLSGNIEKAVQESFGYDLEEFNRKFARYLQRKYLPAFLEKNAPEDYATEIGVRKPGVYTFSPAVSPSGELVAALSTPKEELDLVILSGEKPDPDKRPKVRNLTKGWTNRWRSLVSDAFEGKRDLAWSPSGDEVAVFARRENHWPLLIFDALSGRRSAELTLPGYVESASPAFSPDGKKVAFESNHDGVVDIFEVDLETQQVRNLTADDFFDANPWYSADGRSLLYNRQVGRAWKIFSVDLSDPSRKTQLTFGESSDIQPAASRDGQTVWFSSDRGPEGIYNIHSLDLADGTVRRHTDVIGGCFAPVEMAARSGEPTVGFTSYFQGTFRLFRMPLRQEGDGDDDPGADAAGTPPRPATDEQAARTPDLEPAETKPTEEPVSPVEAEPFEPPIQLTVDESKKRPYAVKWDLEAPSITVGVADDGTLLSNTTLQFSDLLGDRRFLFTAYTVSSFSNIRATYFNLKRRWHWGATAFDNRDYYLSGYYDLSGAQFVDRQQIQRSTGITTFLEYPISRHYRWETSLGLLDSSQDYLQQDQFGQYFFQRVSNRFAIGSVGLVGDTTRFREFGPFQGKRFSIDAAYGADLGGDVEGDFLFYSGDFRTYKQLTRRSVLAWRLSGIWNAGDRESYYGFGGINQLRGYDFRDFFGSRIVWSNLELRFPLVDRLQFPFGSIRQIRGFVFADLGAAWLQDGVWYDPDSGLFRGADPSIPVRDEAGNILGPSPEFSWWDDDESRLQDARGSYGVGFQFFFAGLQLNWSWARRMDYTTFVPTLDPVFGAYYLKTEGDSDGSRMDFYIVYDF